MSIAMLQKQLAKASNEDVALRPYLTVLCKSIGASMIADPERIRITPTVDDSITTSDVSVSLGLIVTELVINALKDAFSDDMRGGTVGVEFSSSGSAWTLTVKDNGMGRPPEYAPGLGTGIIQALSKQLAAVVTVEDNPTGTSVTIKHVATELRGGDGLTIVMPHQSETT